MDLGGTTTKFAITTADGEIQQRWSIDTNVLDEGAHIVPDIIDSINEHISLYQMKPEDFEGIGMGSPGSVDVKAGTVTGAYNLNWKTTQNVKADIEAGTHLALTIDNDANVAALGERWRGAGENEPDVVFVTLGTGVGGGVIADGRLLHGVAGGIVLIFWAANWFYKYVVTRRLRSVGGEINADEFEQNMRKAQIIDLRETNDFNGGHILGARSMPLTQFMDRMTGLRQDLPVYLYDTTGSMSIRAAQMLKKAGFTQVYWLKKGYADWSGKTKKNKY